MAAVPPGPTEVRPKKTSLLFFRKEVDELDELETVKSHFILSFFSSSFFISLREFYATPYRNNTLEQTCNRFVDFSIQDSNIAYFYHN
jgi:hypothetical protein